MSRNFAVVLSQCLVTVEVFVEMKLQSFWVLVDQRCEQGSFPTPLATEVYCSKTACAEG